MDLVLSVGATLIVILLLLQVLMLAIGTNRLLKLQLWAPHKTACKRTSMSELLPVLDVARAELEQAGFRYMHSWRERSMIVSDDMPANLYDVYYHIGQDIHAEVFPAELSTSAQVYTVYLWNTYIDGTALLTVNRLMHALVPYPGRIRVVDSNCSDLAGQLATHLQVREAITVQRTDPAEAPEIAQNIVDRWLVRLEREGQVYQRGQRDEEPVYGFRFLPALRMSWRMRMASWRLKKKTAPASITLNPELDKASLARDRHAFVRTLCALRSLLAPRWYQYTSFALSALVFLGLGAWWWGVTGALTVGAVIALHEGGHWLAMKLAGFRDVQVFFVPGMGGITSGEKHEASPMTHMMVYLAGPMPGLLLSLAALGAIAFAPGILQAEWSPYLMTAVLASFLINGFNLLPVLPLDGGRVIELMIVGRLPWLRFIFSIASGALLLASGINNGDTILRGIGILMLIGSMHHFRVARASALLIKQKHAMPSESLGFSAAASDLYDFLRQPHFNKWAYTTKLSIGQTLLPRYLGRLPGWKESAAGITIYLACILLPLMILGGLLWTSPNAMLSVAGQGFSTFMAVNDQDKLPKTGKDYGNDSTRQWEEELKIQRQARAEKVAAAQGLDRAEIIKAAIDESAESDPEDALRLARIYYAENNNSVQSTYAHADAAYELASALRNWSDQEDQEGARKNDVEAGNYLQEAKAILRARLHANSDRKDARLLAQVLQARDIDADSPAQLGLKQEIVSLFAADKTKDDAQLLQAHQMLAHSFYRSGKNDEAEHELKTAESDYECAQKLDENYLCNSLKTDQAWLLVSRKKLDDAAKMIGPFLTMASNEHTGIGIERDEAHRIRWTIATLQKDFKTAKQEALAIKNARTPSSGNWLLDVFIKRTQPAGNFQADLMLIHSYRALGEQEAADNLVEKLSNNVSKTRANPAAPARATGELFCRTHLLTNSWKNQFQQAMLETEQRELKCRPVPRVALQ
ncbi:hypothetical protein [Undibacterium sp. TJN19]|uniref:site-2 protease family protein n=1 Tax=Undibacterium sp. TJN19 TaxID=3413055 RepID=UPI003BF20981